MGGYLALSKTLALLEPHHQIFECYIRAVIRGGRVLPLRRDAVGVFYNPSRLCCNFLKELMYDNKTIKKGMLFLEFRCKISIKRNLTFYS